jgi:hypothetical protein
MDEEAHTIGRRELYILRISSKSLSICSRSSFEGTGTVPAPNGQRTLPNAIIRHQLDLMEQTSLSNSVIRD